MGDKGASGLDLVNGQQQREPLIKSSAIHQFNGGNVVALEDSKVKNGAGSSQLLGTPLSRSGLKRNTSYGNLMPTDSKETRVRVIYTGGTIGMMRNEQNGKSIPEFPILFNN